MKEKRKKHREISDDASCVLLIHSNVSRALRVRMPAKPKKIVVPAAPKQPSQTTTDFAPLLTLLLKELVIAEPPIRPKTKAAIRATPTTKPSEKRKR